MIKIERNDRDAYLVEKEMVLGSVLRRPVCLFTSSSRRRLGCSGAATPFRTGSVATNHQHGGRERDARVLQQEFAFETAKTSSRDHYRRFSCHFRLVVFHLCGLVLWRLTVEDGHLGVFLEVHHHQQFFWCSNAMRTDGMD